MVSTCEVCPITVPRDSGWPPHSEASCSLLKEPKAPARGSPEDQTQLTAPKLHSIPSQCSPHQHMWDTIGSGTMRTGPETREGAPQGQKGQRALT